MKETQASSRAYNIGKVCLLRRRPTVNRLAYILPFALFAASSALAQGRQIPPGIRQADQTEAQTQKDIPSPSISSHMHVDLAKLHQDADELARISQTIPSDVALIQKGLLPKDMTEKLKQIEKLSKHLRSQISQ
jgi:hypothetical protein